MNQANYWNPVGEDSTLNDLFSDIRRVCDRDIPEHRKHSRDPHGLGHGWYHLAVPHGVEGYGVQPSTHIDSRWYTTYVKLRLETEQMIKPHIFWPPSGLEVIRLHTGRVWLVCRGVVGSCIVCYLDEEPSHAT